jgi:hypothetical protein
MRKSIISTLAENAQPPQGEWLNIENAASVEVTSENPDFPIEAVFLPASGPGWRAAEEGRQIVRIGFDVPRSIHRIQLQFREEEVERTQEFTLRWAGAPGGVFTEIVRQQWNFSPQGSTGEIEDYRVNLPGVSVLELTINPDIGRNDATASLHLWRLA